MGAEFVVEAGDERQAVHLRLMGRHNVLNALAAVAVGVRSGIALESCGVALEALRPTAKRGGR